MSHQFHPTVLREYDIRGIIGETLGPDDARAIGRGFATLLREAGGKKVAVGYDGRVSSPMLEHALVEGLTASGCDVVRIGMGATPMLYYAEASLEEVDGGIQITGSHNPANYNGFKMVFQGRPFFGQDIQKLGQLAAEGAWLDGTGDVSNARDARRTISIGCSTGLDGIDREQLAPDCGSAGTPATAPPAPRSKRWSRACRASTSCSTPRSTATFPTIIPIPPSRKTSRTCRRSSPKRTSISESLSTAMATGSVRSTAKAG